MHSAFFVVILLLIAGSSLTAIKTGALPDPRLTPGDILDVTVTDICVVGYTKKIRDVPASVKRRVYSEYDRQREPRICCEVDHLIPLELGGSNRARNLWPEPYNIEWNARVKDRLERRLHTLVCHGEIDLHTAQKAIAQDWIAAYREYVTGPDSRSRRR
jgi:hypothetical protein